MIPVTAYAGRAVGVLGLGRSGLAAALALRAGGAEPLCWDDAEAARAKAEAAGFEIADLGRAREAARLACLVVSPGIAHLYPRPHQAVAQAQAAGVPVDNDVGLFFRALLETEPEDGPAPKVVAVTGSNGKSTTTALIHHVLRSAGRPAQMGGNIGRGVLGLDPPGPGAAIVLELSSYQIELARALAPDVAVFLNLSPDHLDRHAGMGGYFAAKRRLFELGAPERAIIGIDEAEGRFLANTHHAPILVSVKSRPRGEGWSVFMHRNHLTEWRAGRQQAAIDMRPALALRGAHNHQNAAAAYAACRALGLAPRQIEPALIDFPGLAHRMEPVGSARGVSFVNDSKATNADAAEKALLAFENIRWIAGGRPKEGGIAPLRPLFPRIARAYLIGEAEAAFAATLADVPHARCGTLERAVAAAWAEARPGDVILLSPACASFDQFASFEARGDAFRALASACLEEQVAQEAGP
ncbi:MAG TPA: UDP-N-acetylmuramoyl-L-alanine--D-glutamate ligase [Thermohalobaculum sp.]|nr:UDP-N-acetylmuramoyl-L-alanine--D-glutamate ligase [Thermohalobaculum sp.]